MRVICNLARLREQAGLDLDAASVRVGMLPGVLVRLERGHALPQDDQVVGLQRVYGPPDLWYPGALAAYLTPDVRWCEGCGDELAPHTPREQHFHDEECEQAYRLKTSAPGGSVEGLKNAGDASPTSPAHSPMTTGGQDGR